MTPSQQSSTRQTSGTREPQRMRPININACQITAGGPDTPFSGIQRGLRFRGWNRGKVPLARGGGRRILMASGLGVASLCSLAKGSGLFLDHPAIPISALVRQPGSKGGAIHQRHCTLQCRVFKER
jgi:hypothetical protein